VGAFSFVVTFLIGKLVSATIGLRVDEAAEHQGLDNSQHAETAYELGLVLSRGRITSTPEPLDGAAAARSEGSSEIRTPALGADS
jgi:Ammonium Transporter Family